MSEPQTPAAPWVGWFRPNKATAWTRLVEGNTYDQALDRLLTALASMHGGESVVLEAERSPDDRPPMRRRRF